VAIATPAVPALHLPWLRPRGAEARLVPGLAAATILAAVLRLSGEHTVELNAFYCEVRRPPARSAGPRWQRW
jgi:hypothetical protein